MSCTAMDRVQVEKLEALILAYYDAITALLLTGGVKEYTLNTGQGTQRVTREDVPRMQETLGLLNQQYDALSARCNFGGAINITPGTAPLCL